MLQRGLVVFAVALEGDGDVFVGVDMVERNGAGIALGDRVLQNPRAKEKHKRGKAARIAGARRNG